jgi:large subunit ribosomal protein L25
VTAGDLSLPAGSTLAGDPDQILLLISEAPSEAALEADAAASASETGAAEQSASASVESAAE